MSRKTVLWTLFVTALVLLPPSLSNAQNDDPPAETTLAEGMAGIQESLDRLVGLLESHLQHQRIELLIRRIELAERRLDPLEKRVRNAEAEFRGQESEIVRFESILEEQRYALKREIRDGVDSPDSPTRNTITEIERMLRVQEAEIDEVRRRFRQLEDQLAEQREEIEVLDDALLEMLE